MQFFYRFLPAAPIIMENACLSSFLARAAKVPIVSNKKVAGSIMQLVLLEKNYCQILVFLKISFLPLTITAGVPFDYLKIIVP